MSGLFIPCAVYSLNDESQKGHWAPRAAIRARIRNASKTVAGQAIRKGLLAPYGEIPIQILIEPHECRRTLTDVGNCMASAKAAVDGLKDAKLIVDDSPRYVRALTFLVGRRVAERDQGLRLLFRVWET